MIQEPNIKSPVFENKRAHVRMTLAIPKHSVRDMVAQQLPYKEKSVGSDIVQSDEEVLKGIFEERYEVEGKIGEGAHGVVRVCTSKKNNKKYAVKVLQTDQEHTVMIKKNIRVMKCLKHKNIIHHRVLFLNEAARTSYLVMEYAPYPTLKGLKLTSVEEIAFVAREILSALSYMHGKDICHRDIKPDNILYDRDHKLIKIIDFGICKKTVIRFVKSDMLTSTGTLLYKAPEMFSGAGYDEKVDVWSVGVIMYELIEGRNPFFSQYMSDTIKNIQHRELEFSSPCWSQVPTLCKDFISRLLKKDPEQRFSATEALESLFLSKGQQIKTAHNASYRMAKNKPEKVMAEKKNQMTYLEKKKKKPGNEETPMNKTITEMKMQLLSSEDQEAILETPVISTKIKTSKSCLSFTEDGKAKAQSKLPLMNRCQSDDQSDTAESPVISRLSSRKDLPQTKKQQSTTKPNLPFANEEKSSEEEVD